MKRRDWTLYAGIWRLHGWYRWIPLWVAPLSFEGWRTYLRPRAWTGVSLHCFGYSLYVYRAEEL